MQFVEWAQKWQGAQDGMFHLGAQLTVLKENSHVIILLPHIFPPEETGSEMESGLPTARKRQSWTVNPGLPGCHACL